MTLKKYSNKKFSKGRIPWNKGLTKDTDKRINYVRPTAFKKGNKPWNEGLKGWNEGEKNPFYGKKHTKETIEKLKKSLKNCPPHGMTGKKHSEKTKRKISENKDRARNISKALTGNIVSEKTKQKLREINSGEKHPNWQGGISFEPYDESFNNKFRIAIRKRDNQICMVCGIHREKLNMALDVHHINYDKLMSVPQNCISLCRKCHMLTNKDRKQWTEHFQSLLSKLYDYQYSENKEIILDITRN